MRHADALLAQGCQRHGGDVVRQREVLRATVYRPSHTSDLQRTSAAKPDEPNAEVIDDHVLYGESNVMVRFRVLDWLWKPVGRIVRLLIVHHPVRGTIFLLSTETSLDPLEIFHLYSYRFKIELGFRQAVHVIGTYADHFWMLGMKPPCRGSGDQYLQRTTDAYRGPSAQSCLPTMCMFSSAVSHNGCCSAWPSITQPKFGAAFAVGFVP